MSHRTLAQPFINCPVRPPQAGPAQQTPVRLQPSAAPQTKGPDTPRNGPTTTLRCAVVDGLSPSFFGTIAPSQFQQSDQQQAYFRKGRRLLVIPLYSGARGGRTHCKSLKLLRTARPVAVTRWAATFRSQRTSLARLQRRFDVRTKLQSIDKPLQNLTRAVVGCACQTFLTPPPTL